MDRPHPPVQILSIQSAVTYGHVGNAAAVFPLQRLGFQVWPINTVQFSNHTGYDGWRGERATPAQIADLVDGVADRGVLTNLAAVLSGYLGSAGIVEVVAAAVDRARATNPGVEYCCDPVMGAAGRGLFVDPAIPALIGDLLLPRSGICTPNQYELELLTESPTATTGALLEAIGRLRAAGPRVVLVTSVHTEDTPVGFVDVVCATGDGTWRVRTPILPVRVGGTGDLMAAVFLGHLLRGESAQSALVRATASVFAVLEQTLATGAGEMELIRSQDALVDPPRDYPVERLD